MDHPTQTTHKAPNKKQVSIGVTLMIIAISLWIVSRAVLLPQIYGLAGKNEIGGTGEVSNVEAQQKLALIQTGLTTTDVITVSLFLIGGATILYAYLKGRK